MVYDLFRGIMRGIFVRGYDRLGLLWEGVDRVVVGVLSVTIKGMGNLVVYRRGVYELIGGSYGYKV